MRNVAHERPLQLELCVGRQNGQFAHTAAHGRTHEHHKNHDSQNPDRLIRKTLNIEPVQGEVEEEDHARERVQKQADGAEDAVDENLDVGRIPNRADPRLQIHCAQIDHLPECNEAHAQGGGVA